MPQPTHAAIVAAILQKRCPLCGGHLSLVTNVVPHRIQTRRLILACDRCEFAVFPEEDQE